MKKVLYFAAIAGVALVGCAKVETVEVATPNQEITFNALSYLNTKATDIDGVKYPIDQNFDVWAIYTGDTDFNVSTALTSTDAADFMKGVEQTYVTAENGWAAKGSTKYYWPKAGKLTFWAVSPHGAVDADNVDLMAADKTITKTGYTITDVNPDASVDFMFSDIEANKTAKMYTNGAHNHDDQEDTDVQGSGKDNGFEDYEGVNILFHHALSRIEFQAKKGTKVNANETFTITALKVNDVKSEGDVTVTAKGLLDGATSAFTNGTAEQVNWANQKTPLTLNPLTSGNVVVPENSAAAAKIGDARIVLPQTTEEIVSFTISIKSSIGGIETAPVDYTFKLTHAQHEGVWKWGYKYIYTIIINEDEIYFDPKVVDWTVEYVTLPDDAFVY